MSNSKDRWARIVTVAILAVVIGATVLRQADFGTSFLPMGQKSDPTPQDAVYAMLDAARAGDVSTYLACHTGPMDQSLRRTISESSDFAEYLRDSDAALRGVAIKEPQVLAYDEVRVDVEYVFQDRNESQVLYLAKTPDGWKIARVEPTERLQTPVPYGTPVG